MSGFFSFSFYPEGHFGFEFDIPEAEVDCKLKEEWGSLRSNHRILDTRTSYSSSPLQPTADLSPIVPSYWPTESDL